MIWLKLYVAAYELSRDYLQFKFALVLGINFLGPQKNKLSSFLKHPTKRSEEELKKHKKQRTSI